MKKKLKRGLKRDSIMIKDVSKMLRNNKIDKFKFKVSIAKKICSNVERKIYFLSFELK